MLSGVAAPIRDANDRGCAIWGVLNVTPDSFSDGGEHLHLDDALRRGRAMLAEGADVIDVGGASSRPRGGVYAEGAVAVSPAEECARVVPVIEALARELRAMVSVDTLAPEVALAAITAGAVVVNDVSGGQSEALLRVVADAEVECVLMHTRRRGEIDDMNTSYADVVSEVCAELLRAVERAIVLGVRRDRIWLDPGIGFAKTAAQSLRLLSRIDAIGALGFPVLVGPSRKAFIATAAPGIDGAPPPPAARLGGTLAAVTAAVFGGARAVRVHDVAAARQCVRVAVALRDARGDRSRGGVP